MASLVLPLLLKKQIQFIVYYVVYYIDAIWTKLRQLV